MDKSVYQRLLAIKTEIYVLLKEAEDLLKKSGKEEYKNAKYWMQSMYHFLGEEEEDLNSSSFEETLEEINEIYFPSEIEEIFKKKE